MISWFTSLSGAVALSFVAMLSFIGYTFLVARYVLGEVTPGLTAAAAEALVVIAIAGGWGWALHEAAGGNRSGLIAALIFSLLPALFTVYDLIFQSPISFGWPLVQIVVWITFVSCITAVVAIAIQLRG
jgi:hypothetical protein